MGHPSPLHEYTRGVLRYCCNVDQPACVTLNEFSFESKIQDQVSGLSNQFYYPPKQGKELTAMKHEILEMQTQNQESISA